MGDRKRKLNPEEMATTSAAVSTVPPQLEEAPEPVEPVAVITLRPTKAESRKKVVWTEDTVDNEHMNKKKSKCCCIYEKPRRFDESDSDESDDECEHCFGHVEKKHSHKHKRAHVQSEPGTSTTTEVQDVPAAEPTATVVLRPEEPPAPPDGPPAPSPS